MNMKFSIVLDVELERNCRVNLYVLNGTTHIKFIDLDEAHMRDINMSS